jgi:hypothetical protein
LLHHGLTFRPSTHRQGSGPLGAPFAGAVVVWHENHYERARLDLPDKGVSRLLPRIAFPSRWRSEPLRYPGRLG